MEKPFKKKGKSFKTEISKHEIFSQRTYSVKSLKTDKFSSSQSQKTFSESGIISSRIYVIVLSLMQGLFSIQSLASFMYQKDVLKLEPQTIQFLSGIIALPWCIKPVFGYIFDNLVLRIGKTKYIVYVTSCVRILIFSMIAFYPVGEIVFYIGFFILSLAALFENIICEYTLVITTKRENEINGDGAANHLPIFFGFRAFGTLIGSFFGGRVIKHYGNQRAFFIASILPFINLSLALMYREKPHEETENKRPFKEECKIMYNLVFRDKVLQLILFICLINMTPNFDMLTTFYLTEYLKFSTEDLANFSSFSTVCYILGLLLYSYFFKNINAKRFYITTNFMLWICNLSFLLVVLKILDRFGIDNRGFCLFSQGVQSFISELNFMPILAIWCAICPKDLEATSITLFTGLLNFSGNLSNYFGSFLIWVLNIHRTNYDKIWLPIVIQNSYLLIMMLGIAFIEFPNPKEGLDDKKNDRNIQLDLEENDLRNID